ncbi:hypothetical protein KUTeg_009829 [Tegillarca granosa]|uniref:Uncharacterized protein n=1 Tax=Tegillarca granosa TaxID=220873 RepID=A0ABQ9F510_TEGGR|nr:hypothetical protein KUTeg_009829 [Tegillarca granosa]
MKHTLPGVTNHKHSYSISDPGIFYWPPLYVKSELRSISNLQQNTQHDLQQNRDEDLQQNPDTKLHVSEQYSDVAKPDNCAVNLSNGDFIAAVYDNVRIHKEQTKESEEYTRMCRALSLCIAYAANVGGIGSLTGTLPNIVLKGQADIVFQESGGESPVTFTTWMIFGLPLSLLVVILIWIWLQLFFLRFKKTNVNERVKEAIRKEYEALGPVSFAQAAVMVHFALMAILWITRDLGGIGGRLQLNPLLSWKIAQEKIPWGVFLLLGGGFALAKGSQATGVTEVTSNTATCTLMMPIMAIATPPNAVVFSYGNVRVIDMVAAGFFINVIAVPVLVLATETWGNAYFNFHTLPDIFQKNITIATTAELTSVVPYHITQHLLNTTGS